MKARWSRMGAAGLACLLASHTALQAQTRTGSTLGTNEDNTLSAVLANCLQLIPLGDKRTPGQADLFTRCGEVLSEVDAARQRIALNQIGREEVGIVGSQVTETTQSQLAKVQERTAALRGSRATGSIASLGLSTNGSSSYTSSYQTTMAFGPNARGGLHFSTAGLATPMSAAPVQEGSGGGAGDVGSKFGWFLSGDFASGDKDATVLEDGYDFDGYDLTVGFDFRTGPASFFGIAAGVQSNDVKVTGEASEVDSDGFTLSFYGGWGGERAFFDYAAAYGSNDYESRTAIAYSVLALPGGGPQGLTIIDQTAIGDTEGDDLLVSATLGIDVGSGSFSFQPYLRGTFSDVSIDGYEEQLTSMGPGFGLGLRVEDQDIESLTSDLGADLTWAVSTGWGVFVPTVIVEWTHQFSDDEREVLTRFLNEAQNPANFDAKNLKIFTDEPDRDYFNISAGFQLLFSRGTQFYLLYNTIAGLNNVSYNGGSIGLRFEI